MRKEINRCWTVHHFRDTLSGHLKWIVLYNWTAQNDVLINVQPASLALRLRRTLLWNLKGVDPREDWLREEREKKNEEEEAASSKAVTHNYANSNSEVSRQWMNSWKHRGWEKSRPVSSPSPLSLFFFFGTLCERIASISLRSLPSSGKHSRQNSLSEILAT